MFKLVIQDDEGKTTIVPLIRDEITIGRKEGNTIRLTERNVSRRHARILRNNGEVHIEDLGSYNGIRVNNARIAERVSLRVSDQVQIGDYKLYLKAEGVEPADESRTNQIERVEPAAATEVMAPVVPPAITPPPVMAPVSTIPPIPGSGRTVVPVTGTDQTRTVGPATAEALSALTAPTGYAKLVVLSSNFAGKEFELSRPQMIIGRTDENDIVVNHRSISRNHAKLVREPDAGRYTISDLQSSNGVRVNGSDYGKVELRRGDVIDLGHVRLRFVDAGEDFVFARDAVITDVPETGGRRGMLFAVLAAIVVLVAGAVVYVMHASPPQSPPTPGSMVTPGSGAVPDADEVVAEHAADVGSAAAVTAAPGAVGAVAPPTEEPAPPAVAVAGSGSAMVKSDDIKRCAELEVKQRWQELHDCAAGLAAGAAKDKAIRDKAEEFRQKAVRETGAALVADKFQAALRDGNLREAQKQLRAIGPDSVYYAASSEAFRAAEARASEDARRKAVALAAAHDCQGVRRLQAQLAASSTPVVTGAITAVKCADKSSAIGEGPVRTPATAPAPGSSELAAAPPKNPCEAVNIDDLLQQAQNQFTAGFARSALSLVTKALNCKQDVRMYRYAVTYACSAHDAAAAKLYFSKVPPQFQSSLIQKCQQENITVP